MRKRIISACLALCLALSLLPVNVWAAEDQGITSPGELLMALPGAAMEAGEITLSKDVSLTGDLRINCNAAINLNNYAINADSHYIRVDNGQRVTIQGGTITSSSDTAAVVAMRGCDLTIEYVDIEVDDNANGYGILVNPNPTDKNILKTMLNLETVRISGGQGGLTVHGTIQDTQAGKYPILNLSDVQINQGTAENRIGLYLAGMAETTITGGFTDISGNPAIGIKSGTLTVSGGTITGCGRPVSDPIPNGSGIDGDGSAILIENNPGYAGNMNITIDGNAIIDGENNYTIREFTAEGWTGTAPKIEVNGGTFKGTTKTEHKITVGEDGWSVLTREPQIIKAYGKNDEYQEAYNSIGVNLREPTSGQAYTLEMDIRKLENLLDNPSNNKYWDTMAEKEKSDNLWYRAKFLRPSGVKNVAAAEIQVVYNKWSSYGQPDPAQFETVKKFESDGSFYYPVTIYDADTNPGGSSFSPSYPNITGMTVYVRWKNQSGGLLAVSEATIEIEPVHPVKVIFENSKIPDDLVSRGDLVTRPKEDPKESADPTQKGWVFGGWYTSPNYRELWDFEKMTVSDDPTYIYARWLEPVIVTFDWQDGSTNTEEEVTVGKGTPVTRPEKDPTWTGHQFVGWFKDKEYTEPWNFNTEITEATTIYAKWKQEYTVTFEGPEGIDKPVDSQTVVEGGTATRPKEDPALENQEFDDWFEDEQCTKRWDFNTPITKDTTIYGKWKQEYTVTFDSQGGSKVENQTVFEGGTATRPESPTKDGYQFDNWYEEAECKNKWNFSDYKITSDVTIYGNWKKIHTVKFDSQGGSAVESQPVVEGGMVKVPEAPVRDKYRIVGWFREQACENEWDFKKDVVTGDMTLYAKWQETCTVSFDSQGGSAVESQTVDKNATAVRPTPNPTKIGYDFDKWYKDPDGQDECVFNDYKIEADVTLYAGWLVKPRTVTLNANGGTFADGVTATTAKTDRDGRLVEELPTPSRSGYTFIGWYTEAEEGEAVSAATKFEADATIYAHWVPLGTAPSTPRAYTITFNANGGGSNVTRSTGTDGKLSSLPDAPSRTGYTFEGWFTAASGGTQVTTATVFQGHTTVYAHWKASASSGQPSDPSNPSTPSGSQYQIFTPSATSGGSVSVSRTAAAEGERITIRLSPWSGYQLYQLSVTNYGTGRQLSLSRVSANEYTFVMPAGSVSVAATFTGGYTGGSSSGQAQSANESAGWYFSGSSIYHRTNGAVSPAEALSRDMLISVLYNLDGSSHEEPAAWAVSNGIIPDVYSSLLWGSDKAITREQTALILYSYAEYKGYGTSQRASLAGYTDYSQIRAAAQPAMSWARATGLMTGTSANTLSPQANLTCAQAGIVISRFITSVVRAR